MQCSCHSGIAYEECCKKYHSGELPNDALSLMRSRYAAYSLGNAEYIINTTHPDNPQFLQDRKKWKEQILDFCDKTTFQNLTIIETVPGENLSFVTFLATLSQMGSDASFTERSRFEKMGGLWLYHSGEFMLNNPTLSN